MDGFAGVEHRPCLCGMPLKRRERCVGVADCGLPQHLEAMICHTSGTVQEPGGMEGLERGK